MEKLSYKSFVFPTNPHTYREEAARAGKFRKRIITGTGAFFGEKAVEEFRKLQELFEETEAGNLEHPLWGIKFCYFTGLDMIQEPKQDYVAYKFTFEQAETNGYLPR